MIAIDLISDEIPPIKTSDTGSLALQYMEDFKLKEIPIVNNSVFLGLITEDDIYDLDNPETPIGNHALSLSKGFVYQHEHVFEIIGKMAALKLTVIPVLDEEDNYLGVISQGTLIERISALAAMKDPGGILQLEMNAIDYSLSEISRIVESNGAKILSSYIYMHDDSAKMDVTIKINQTSLGPIVQTFERYNYTLIGTFHKNEDDNDLKKRYDAFLNYLNM
jgi:CBS domain-containing protein